jgi:hypothetical protein
MKPNTLAAFAAVAAVVGLGSAATPTAAASLLSLNAPVSCSGFYNAGSETFPCSNVDDGKTGDSGSPSNWSFWLSPGGTNTGQFVTIDLGAVDSISSIVVEDTHNRGYFDRGTQDFTIAVSNDDVHFTTIVTSAFSNSDWQNLTDLTYNVSASGRYVEFTAVDPNSCWGCGSVGLNEMSVFGAAGASGTPEPATWAMMLIGFGGVGAVMRSARRKVSRALA